MIRKHVTICRVQGHETRRGRLTFGVEKKGKSPKLCFWCPGSHQVPQVRSSRGQRLFTPSYPFRPRFCRSEARWLSAKSEKACLCHRSLVCFTFTPPRSLDSHHSQGLTFKPRARNESGDLETFDQHPSRDTGRRARDEQPRSADEKIVQNARQ